MSLRRTGALVGCVIGLCFVTLAHSHNNRNDTQSGQSKSAQTGAQEARPRGSSRGQPRAKGRRAPPRTAGPVAMVPGFRMLDGGGSRVYVELTSVVPIEWQAGPLSLVYRLRGTTVLSKNNRNPLITTHFSTPVARAQLVPRGPDLDLVVALRAPVMGKHQLVDQGGGVCRLEIDFPAGVYPVEMNGRDPSAGASDGGDRSQGAATPQQATSVAAPMPSHPPAPSPPKNTTSEP